MSFSHPREPTAKNLREGPQQHGELLQKLAKITVGGGLRRIGTPQRYVWSPAGRMRDLLSMRQPSRTKA